jgi:nucleotide-binding universal stress UspA family protein
MYRRIVLAFDGAVEGRAALREGAILAKRCGSEVFLLSVLAESSGLSLAEGALVGSAESHMEAYDAVLQEGLRRLEQLGFTPTGKLVRGEPAREIGEFARQVDADLVVVGHRRRNLLERWWAGSTGAYIVDNLNCSLLVARRVISDEAFEAEIRMLAAEGR